MSLAKTLMIQGCTSDAGKSYLAAGFCRLYAKRGFKVAPFKAQNMSNNAGVTPAGGEMGRAQLLQAQAARATPDVRMNPVLLKPEADTRSQVVLLGKANLELSALPWLERKTHLWEYVRSSLASLRSEYDLIVIEGAGSPGEINLKASDIVNMRVAREVGAAVLLISDIDRGGAFAHLLGTWHTFDEEEKNLLCGFVLNKFRGDAALLGNALAWLESRTQIPTLGIVPMLKLPLPEEDAFSLQSSVLETNDKPLVAIIKTPYISNFDEFDALLREPQLAVRFVEDVSELQNAKAIILGGSKVVGHDLRYLLERGFAGRLHELAGRGVPILGICGGLQMLGQAVRDPLGIEGKSVQGLGLLGVVTELAATKTTRQAEAVYLPTGAAVTGYEIHHGRTRATPQVLPLLSDNLGFVQGNISGVYLHGIFDNAAFRAAFCAQLGVTANPGDWLEQVDAALDTLATHLETHCDMDAIDAAVFG